MAENSQHEHKTHTPTFIAVFVLLCGLTGASYWIANSNMMVESIGTARGLLIAVSAAKAFLVIMFFMHLWWEKSWKYILTLPALVLAAVLVMLLIPDIGMRTETYSSDRQLRAPAPQTNSANVKDAH
jgi:cytochrome c oxidase subunit 4